MTDNETPPTPTETGDTDDTAPDAADQYQRWTFEPGDTLIRDTSDQRFRLKSEFSTPDRYTVLQRVIDHDTSDQSYILRNEATGDIIVRERSRAHNRYVKPTTALPESMQAA